MESWTAEKLSELATAYWKSAALCAAVELGLFDALDGSPTTSSAMAERLATSPHHTEVLMDALCGMGILRKQDRGYQLAPGASEYLSRSNPHCLLDALRFNIDLYPLWGRLARCVRQGKPEVPPGSHVGGDPERTRRFVMGMHSRALAMGPSVVPFVDLSGCRSLLDVGAGPGTWSRLLAERYADLRVTLLDLPPVLRIARELLKDFDGAERLTDHPADYRRDPLPGGFDAVLFSGALHQETPESAKAIAAKIAGALRPGGRAIIVDMMLEPDHAHPEFSALFSLNMLLTSPGGRVYSAEAVCRLLEEAGLEKPCCHHLQHVPYWMVVANKPDLRR